MKYRLDEKVTVYSDTSSTSSVVAELRAGDEVDLRGTLTSGGERWHGVTVSDGKAGYIAATTKGTGSCGDKGNAYPLSLAEPLSTLQENRSPVLRNLFAKAGAFLGAIAALFLPMRNVFEAFFVGGICGVLGGVIAGMIGDFLDAVYVVPDERTQQAGASKTAFPSLCMGVASLFAWFIPAAGLPLSILGYFLGRKACASPRRTMALLAMTLCLVGLVISVANGASGLILGYQRFISQQGK